MFRRKAARSILTAFAACGLVLGATSPPGVAAPPSPEPQPTAQPSATVRSSPDTTAIPRASATPRRSRDTARSGMRPRDVTAQQNTPVDLKKRVEPEVVPGPGFVVRYIYEITNTGPISVSNVRLQEREFTGTGPRPSGNCPSGTTLQVGATLRCEVNYVVTQEDADRGFIRNVSVATFRGLLGITQESNLATAVVTIPPAPHLDVRKTANPPVVQSPGQLLEYRFEVTNTGNVDVRDLFLADSVFTGTGPPPTITCPAGTLPPGATTVCRATYVVTPDDLNHGAIHDQAIATARAPSGMIADFPSNPVDVPVAAQPGLALTKKADPSTATAAGETVKYVFEVKNTGNVTADNIGVSERDFSGTGPPPTITCDTLTLAPGQTTTCTGTYTVTQDDLDRGQISNTATALGTSAGRNVESAESSFTVNSLTAPDLAMTKTASPTTVTAAGETVTYSHVVTNTGNTTMSNIRVTETQFSGSGTPPTVTCPVTTLAPGESTTCTGTYTVTQADVDAGSITNEAFATGAPPNGSAEIASAPSAAAVNATPTAGLELVKSADPATVAAAGQTVTYSYAITNAGTGTLTGISATDTAFTGTGTPPAVTCPVTTLAPGESTTCTGTYTVTQADIDAGAVIDTGQASGTAADGSTVASNHSTAAVNAAPASALTLVKTAAPGTVTAAGQQVTYSYAITNSGNRTLTGISATDTDFTGTGTPPSPTCPVTTLAPGESTVCTGTYTVTQADIEAGSISNTGVAAGSLPGRALITSNQSTATVAAAAEPGLSLAKRSDTVTVTAAGQQVTYQHVVTNTGNTTLTGVAVTDTAFSGSGTPPVVTCPVTTLAPGESTTCTGTYTVTQADVDAGSITNTATASGTAPDGTVTTPASSTAAIAAEPTADLTVVKSASPAVATAGETVTFSYVVTDTGSASLTGVTAQDTAFSGSGTPPVVTCPVTTLAPGESTTCTGTYTVTPADVANGGFVDAATASGTAPGGTAVTSASSTATVAAVEAAAALEVRKTADPTTVQAGETVTFTHEVTNIGDETLSEIAIQETVFSGTGTPPNVTCEATTLAPGQTTTCTGTYVATAEDAAAGMINNTAVASGTTAAGTAVTSDPATATVTAEAATPPGPSPTPTATARPRATQHNAPKATAVNGDNTNADLDVHRDSHTGQVQRGEHKTRSRSVSRLGHHRRHRMRWHGIGF